MHDQEVAASILTQLGFIKQLRRLDGWMCLAIPAKVIGINGNIAKVDFGDGTLRDVDVSLVEVNVGDYVLVHAGFAIQTLKEDEALKTIELLNEILGG